ncbi:sugar-binding domain-containing protein, partial [Streptomyces sp. NPDC058964]|uniref:glycosyl hydrolase 2 galactose-binding domain-containing protein n=1 Tax=Streptomyces sp. NPDC058964 TaxID=3346681 RepID=UPI0036800CEB
MFPRPAPRARLATAAVVLGLIGSLSASAWAGTRDPARTPGHVPVTRVPSAAGTGTPLSGYAIQSTAEVGDSASAVSSPGYPATGWYPAGPRSTVLAALLADGVYADPFYSTNQQKIPKADFQVPWWYRSDFRVDDTSERTYLDFSGVISAADVYVNGRQVAKASDVTGSYTHHELDVTSLVRPGTNTVALRIRPNVPNKNLTMGWIDWLQPPPDENMGIVRDVLVRRGGPVALRDAHVVTRLDVPSLASADLTVKARVRTDSDAP